jgi:hypothetical protein
VISKCVVQPCLSASHYGMMRASCEIGQSIYEVDVAHHLIVIKA